MDTNGDGTAGPSRETGDPFASSSGPSATAGSGPTSPSPSTTTRATTTSALILTGSPPSSSSDIIIPLSKTPFASTSTTASPKSGSPSTTNEIKIAPRSTTPTRPTVAASPTITNGVKVTGGRRKSVEGIAVKVGSPLSTPPRGTTGNSRTPTSTSSPASSSPPTSSSSPRGGSPKSSSPSASTSALPGTPTRRVKLYRLQEDQWLDLGTGNCTGNLHESDIPSEEGAFLHVTSSSESNPTGELIFRTRIHPYPTGYLSDEEDEDDLDAEREGKVRDVGGFQRQQDTLIVWTEQESEVDMALSFATVAGCAEIWEFVRTARRWTSEQPVFSPSIASASPPQLPPSPMHDATNLPVPSLGNIEEFEAAIRSLGRTAIGRERTASSIIKGSFIQKLIRIQEEAEDLESLSDLHALCRVMQSILLLNDNVIFDLVLRDEIVLGVAGILEYDPEFPTMKASYRTHLADPSHFTQVVPIRSCDLLAKIHQTHRLHYFKDVVLARILEDSTFSMLNSAIYFNEVDIVNEVAADGALLRELFAVFDEEDEGEELMEEEKGEEGMIGPRLPKAVEALIGPQQIPTASTSKLNSDAMDTSDPTTSRHFPPSATPTKRPISAINSTPPRDKKHDAILFLQQFSQMAKNLQLPARASFFRNLADKGLLRVIEVALSRTITREDPIMRGATIEILMMLVDHDPNNVRGYSLKQHGAGKRPLVVFLIELFHTEEDLGLKAQMSEALRVLVDAGGNGGPLEAPPRLRPEDPEAEKFLQYFYDNCILSMLAPILALPEQSASDPPLDLPLPAVALAGHLCDLLCFFVSHHSWRSKYFVLSTSISTCIAKLLKARHKHLRLAALRYFRACVGKNDDFFNRFLIKNVLLEPILEIAKAESEKDNLLGSASLEFFEFIRTTNAKALINSLMSRSEVTIRALADGGLKTFQALITRWEQNNEPPPVAASKDGAAASVATSKSMTREGGSWSRMDMEEESYFDGSDEEDDGTTRPSRKRDSDSSDSNLSKKPKLDSPTDSPKAKTIGGMSRSITFTSGLDKGKGKSLVDYGDDSDEELSPGGFESTAVTPSSPSTNGAPLPSTTSIESSLSTELNEADATEPPLFTPGELMRRKEADEEEALGILGTGKRPSSVPPVIHIPKGLFGSNKALSTGGLATGVKFSFGGGIGKLVGGSAAKDKKEKSG